MLILVDANVIIELHLVERWEVYTREHSVAIPQIIAKEALFSDSGDIRRKRIAEITQNAITSGNILEFSADEEELLRLNEHFDDLFLENIHAGEYEALALLLTNRCQEYNFCSADAVALRAAAMLGLSDRCVCLDNTLREIGYQCSLSHQFCQDFMDRCLTQGSQDLITGLGMRR